MFSEYKLDQIGKFYSKDHLPRYQALIKKFTQTFGVGPDFISRAPGRVNIIGQHIDYQGYGVFPSAIEKDCLIAVKITNNKELQIHHFNSLTYPTHKTAIDPNYRQEYPNKYFNYLMGGYRAGVQFVDKQNLVGMQMMVTGNVPLGSGLSSSAAMVVSSALASYYANKQNGKVSASEFIQQCIRRERQTGVACGGMDQSISVMGKLGNCQYIQFNPIRCEKIPVPEGCKLIIMNSLVQNVKANSAVFRYNKRVVECRLGLFLMAKNLNIKPQVYIKWKILKDLQQNMNLSIRMIGLLVEISIQKRPYDKKTIQSLLGEDVWKFVSDIQLSKQVLEANETFNLFEAVKHVFQEAQRVLDLIEICRSSLSDQAKNKMFGKLMNESHASCRDVYQCSCEELDQITSLALKYGALGSRLTGAGWGGCSVSLVQNDKVEKFISDMKNSFYAKQPYKSRAEKQGIQNVIFQSKPCQGACIILI